MHNPLKQIDTKELELPETVFIRDIETKVFQSIVLQSLSAIEGVQALEGNFFDSLLGDGLDGVKGIHVDQDQKNHGDDLRGLFHHRHHQAAQAGLGCCEQNGADGAD